MNDDDLYAERLRDLLHGEGSQMEIADDGLARILQQARSSGGGRTRRPAWLAPLAVAAAAVVLLGGLAIGVSLNRGDGDHTTLPATSSSNPGLQSSSPAPSSSLPSNSSTPTESTSSPTPPVPTGTFAIYYVADVPGVGPRLYREFHPAFAVQGNDPAKDALSELFGGNALDPDYTSIWPSGTQALNVDVNGDLATVNVTDFPAVGSEGESLAVQQIVWTVTAADKNVKQVKLLVNGKTPKSGVFDLSKPVGRANAFDVEANVWILAPTEGATVTSPVKVTVYGTGFEGNVPIQIWDSTGSQIATKALTTQTGSFAQASTTFKLPPGSYEVRAYNDNGKNATLQLWDTKTFTVS